MKYLNFVAQDWHLRQQQLQPDSQSEILKVAN
jgi:hypothetical protein